MKQIHHRTPAPAPQGLFDHRQIVRRLRSQREGFEESEAPVASSSSTGSRTCSGLLSPGSRHNTTVAAVRSRLTEV